MSIVAACTLANRLLGFARDMLFAQIVGAGMVADAFLIAYRFPYFFGRLFTEGAFNAAFVPTFTATFARSGEAAARRFAAESVVIVALIMLACITVGLAAMPWLMYFIAPGFSRTPAKLQLAVELARLAFPYLIFVALVAVLSSLLNAIHRFAVAAMIPAVLSITFITVLLLMRTDLVPKTGHVLAISVTVAGALQLIILLWACQRAGYAIVLPRPRLSPEILRLRALLLPGIVGTGVIQANVLIDEMLASLLPQGSISFIYYSFQLVQLPVGMASISVGMVLLPTLSQQIRVGDTVGARGSQNRAIEFTLLLTLPAAAALLTIPDQIVSVLFQRGAFDEHATASTAAAVRAFALGIPAFVLIRTLSSVFFARGDTRLPMKIAIIAVFVNLLLALCLMHYLLHVGLMLATVIAAWVNLGLLTYEQYRRRLLQFDATLRHRALRITLSAVVMAPLVCATAEAFAEQLTGATWERVLALAVIVSSGAAIYLLLIFLLGAFKTSDLKTLLRL